MTTMDNESKAYVDSKVKELKREITENIATPLSSNLKTIASVIEKYDELLRRVGSLEKDGTKAPGGSSIQGELPSFKDIMDSSLNMMAIPFIESMKFVILVMTLVDKKIDTQQIKDKVLSEYGTVMGRLYIESLNDVIQQTNKKNIKKVCSDILDSMRGAPVT